jgi:hypothetical protein
MIKQLKPLMEVLSISGYLLLLNPQGVGSFYVEMQYYNANT